MIFHDMRILEDLFKPFRLEARAKEFSKILQRAFLVGRAVSAIHIVDREEQAEGASL